MTKSEAAGVLRLSVDTLREERNYDGQTDDNRYWIDRQVAALTLAISALEGPGREEVARAAWNAWRETPIPSGDLDCWLHVADAVLALRGK